MRKEGEREKRLMEDRERGRDSEGGREERDRE